MKASRNEQREQSSTDPRKSLGKLGEDEAEAYLLRQGYQLIHRNWRCKTGELDLIVQEGLQLIFVEVRTRRMTGTFGTPRESVNARKQQKIVETARVYIHMFHLYEQSVRFDVISVMADAAGRITRLEHEAAIF